MTNKNSVKHIPWLLVMIPCKLVNKSDDQNNKVPDHIPFLFLMFGKKLVKITRVRVDSLSEKKKFTDSKTQNPLNFAFGEKKNTTS